jgi:hypothetical protein
MQYSPLVHNGFVKMLRGYKIDISETRLVLVTGDALRLEPTALHIQQNLLTQGMRTIGMDIWSGSDASINRRPFVFQATTCTYNSRDYDPDATRAEALFVRLSGARTGVTASLARLEELVIDPAVLNVHNVNRGGNASGGDPEAEFGLLYSNLRRSDEKRKRKAHKAHKAHKAASCGHCRDHHPDDPCGAMVKRKCTKTCVSTCGK